MISPQRFIVGQTALIRQILFFAYAGRLANEGGGMTNANLAIARIPSTLLIVSLIGLILAFFVGVSWIPKYLCPIALIVTNFAQ